MSRSATSAHTCFVADSQSCPNMLRHSLSERLRQPLKRSRFRLAALRQIGPSLFGVMGDQHARNKMSFFLTEEQQRQDVVAYLKTLSGGKN